MLKETAKSVLDFIKMFAPSFLVALFIINFLIANAYVPSGSMETTIMTGSRLVGNRLAYRFSNEPERGDIIIFRYPDNEKIYYVKRIVGTPGDTVEIIPNGDGFGHVYINGHPISEPYLKEEMYVEKYQKFEVPENAYFCMGDNRNDSADARYWKNPFVYKNKIIAKVLFQYWNGFKIID